MARILIIDDDPAILTLVRKTLEKAGHQAELAMNGSDGLTSFRVSPVDLVLTDIFMPDMDGLDVIREIKRINPDTRIIAFSGGGMVIGVGQTLQAARKVGAFMTLDKPFSRNQLLDTVHQALNKSPAVA